MKEKTFTQKWKASLNGLKVIVFKDYVYIICDNYIIANKDISFNRHGERICEAKLKNIMLVL